ncbi:MAG: hypothetical protein ACI4CC_01525 [Lachnospiraceae bacterium]
MTKTYEVTWRVFCSTTVEVPNAEKMTKKELKNFLNDERFNDVDYDPEEKIPDNKFKVYDVKDSHEINL